MLGESHTTHSIHLVVLQTGFSRGLREDRMPKIPPTNTASEDIFGSCYDVIFKSREKLVAAAQLLYSIYDLTLDKKLNFYNKFILKLIYQHIFFISREYVRINMKPYAFDPIAASITVFLCPLFILVNSHRSWIVIPVGLILVYSFQERHFS